MPSISASLSATSATLSEPGAERRLIIPGCEPGIGHVVLNPGAATLIDGVRIEPYSVWPDDRGFFLEVARLGEGIIGDFPLQTSQISTALSYPGTIKAFHYHQRQTDYWVAAQGMFQFALVDLRENSPTYGRKNTMYVGELRPWRVIIPPGVGHGYKVVGERPGMLVYVTDRKYNPEDEGRIPYDEPRIAYDWELQHK